MHVIEGHRVFTQISVTDNLLLAGYDLPRGERAARVEEALSFFPEIAEKRHERGGALSGGQQQMLTVAQGLVRRPRLLMLDEPSAGLSPVLVDRVLNVIGAIAQPGHRGAAGRAVAGKGARRRRPRLRAGAGPHRAGSADQRAQPAAAAGARLFRARKPRDGFILKGLLKGLDPVIPGWSEEPDSECLRDSGFASRPGMTGPMLMRLPFFYGWIIIAVTFVTMAIGVNARTSFSLLFPPIINEFGWERGVTAGAFSFGFLVSAAVSPLIGRMMDRSGPRTVMELGVALMAAGLLLAPLTTQPWHLYLTIGVLVGSGSICLGYSGQSLFLPNWFNRRRGLAMGLAFAGVGLGSITLLPWMQHMIEQTGWRTACTAMGILVLVVLAPINLLLRKRPEDIGLQPDGDAAPSASSAQADLEYRRSGLGRHRLDLSRALRTARFWWLAVGYFCGLYIWYAVQVHQTKYLLDIGFSPSVAVWALGAVSLLGIPGQIVLGHLSDRLGREWIWSASCLGFAICYAALIAMANSPTLLLVYVMVLAQGVLGYGLTSIMGAVVVEIFQGKNYGSIFGTVMLAAIIGGAAGPWVTGFLHDLSGNYTLAFAIGIAVSGLSAVAIWMASPGKIRAVAGQLHKMQRPAPAADFIRPMKFPCFAADRRSRAGNCRPAWSPDRSGGADESRPPAPARSRRSRSGSAIRSCRCFSTWSRRYRR